MSLEGKVAIVTGGAGHIGRTTARRLAADGATVAVCDVNGEGARTVADSIVADGGRATAVAVDVRSVESVEAMVEQVIDRYGRIDILVNVAGGSARERASEVRGSKEEVIREIIEVNLFGVIFCCRAVIGHMIAQGGGRIVSVASTLATQPLRGHADYCAAKAGVVHFTRAFAIEVAPYNVFVNCVSPGLVPRPNTPTAGVAEANYLGRLASPETVAHLIAFLIADETDFIVGQNYGVDGGWGLAVKSGR